MSATEEAADPQQAAPDAAAPALERVFGPRLRRLTIGIIAVVSLMAFEGMAVATAMPIAVTDLDGLAYYAWAFTMFGATFLWATIVSGEAADLRGPRRPLLLGIGCFIGGLLLSGTAQSMAAFVAGRALQGIGGGAVIVALYVVVGRAYPRELQPRAFSAMASAWVVPGLVGPLIAGYLAEGPGWRWVFLLVPMLVAPAMVLVWPTLRRMGPPENPKEARSGRRRLALAIAVGAAAIQYAGQRREAVLVLALLAVGALLLIWAVPRLLPAGTLRLRRGLPSAIAIRGILAGGFFGVEAFLPLFLVSERGLSATAAGLSLAGGAIGWASGSYWQGRKPGLTRRIRFVAVGSVVVAIVMAVVSLVALPAVPPLLANVCWLFAGLGMGLAMPSLSVLVLQYSAPEEQGANSAALQLSDGLGAVLTVSAGGIWYAATGDALGSITFLVLFAALALLPLLAAAAAPRLRVGAAAGPQTA